jgi:hypothetical protein
MKSNWLEELMGFLYHIIAQQSIGYIWLYQHTQDKIQV